MRNSYGNLLCERCGVRPALRHTIAVLGPLDLREDHLCLGCQEEVDAAGEASPPDGSPADLGPIDFSVLRASIQRAEATGEEGAETLAFVAGELRGIAAAHGQVLPADIQDFVNRYAG